MEVGFMWERVVSCGLRSERFIIILSPCVHYMSCWLMGNRETSPGHSQCNRGDFQGRGKMHTPFHSLLHHFKTQKDSNLPKYFSFTLMQRPRFTRENEARRNAVKTQWHCRQRSWWMSIKRRKSTDFFFWALTSYLLLLFLWIAPSVFGSCTQWRATGDISFTTPLDWQGTIIECKIFHHINIRLQSWYIYFFAYKLV